MLSVIAKKCDYDLLINQSTSNIYLRRFGLAFSENYNLCFVFHFLLVDIIFFFKYLYCRLKLLSVKKKIITLSKFSVFFSLILLCECLRLRFACCEHQPIWIFVSILSLLYLRLPQFIVYLARTASTTPLEDFPRDKSAMKRKKNRRLKLEQIVLRLHTQFSWIS